MCFFAGLEVKVKGEVRHAVTLIHHIDTNFHEIGLDSHNTT